MADRTGSWLLNLSAVSESLPVFASAGYYSYLKSAHFYVQEMEQLEHTHPDMFQKFSNGLHVIRRSDQYWAGLSSDLAIEQTLMRSLKSSGGLTWGSGMTEEQRSLWTMSAPNTAEYNKAMQELNDLSYTTSDQHKDLTKARMRDASDLQKLKTKLLSCSPSSEDSSLRNVVGGVVANPHENVLEYESIGKKIIENMIGQSAFRYSFKRKNKAITLGDVSAIKVAPDQSIDPALLFQRLLVVAKTGELSLEYVLGYELSPFPPALFEIRNVFHKPDKPQLAHAISDHLKEAGVDPPQSTPQTEHYVLDGGSLLHQVPWKKGDSYSAMAESYADFTIRKYGVATVVFDGYNGGLSIKATLTKGV
ncbi:uncharacterized protein LOC135207244 [Macrobrachium nipponense]|uniref:uncharacterized protein LOC135207244 n=1 Tax=Macrobrachium nipponense TaxID=159736 RepID=UPI0030C7B0C2